MRRAVLVILLSVAVGCGREGGGPPTTPTPLPGATISEVARVYLDQLIGIMQASSINRMTIDWTALRAEVFNAAGNAQTIADTFPAIRAAIARLADGHSSYRSPSGTVIFVARRSCVGSGGPSNQSVPDSIGYVSVGAFSGTSAEAQIFADGIQNAIRNADRDGLVGWIVDLRGNGGGNMWPMIAGLGPILGEGVLGYFVNPTGVETRWEYQNGASWSGGNRVQSVTSPYRLRREGPRVAVLTDNAVASSGEATAIAFRQRPDARSFGAPTCGLSTANSPFPLSDGATLNLTVSTMADRTKTLYGDSVAPDEIVATRDLLIARAVAWLREGS